MVATAARKNTKKIDVNPEEVRESRLKFLEFFTEGDRVYCQLTGRYGTYKGIQDLPMPDAWVIFDDKQIHEPVSPRNLIKQPAWKEGDKLIHATLGSGVAFEVCGHSLKDCEVSWIKAPAQQASSFDIPEDFDGEALSREEVEKLIERIVETSESIKSLALFAKNFTRYALVVIDAREGYKVYECDSMSQFLEDYSHLFKKAYSSLQKEWQAGRLEYDLGFKIGTLPETQARELYPLKENLDDCRKAWESACEKAESENRKVKSSDIGAAVREIANLPEPPKKIRTKCGWVAGPNAARHYVVKIFNSEINLHDTYDAAARMIIDFAEARKQAPEGLIVEGLIGKLGEVLGVSNVGAVAAAVDYIKGKQHV